MPNVKEIKKECYVPVPWKVAHKTAFCCPSLWFLSYAFPSQFLSLYSLLQLPPSRSPSGAALWPHKQMKPKKVRVTGHKASPPLNTALSSSRSFASNKVSNCLLQHPPFESSCAEPPSNFYYRTNSCLNRLSPNDHYFPFHLHLPHISRKQGAGQVLQLLSGLPTACQLLEKKPRY